jgi:primosomal protein N' (replication factor Y)
MVLVQTFNPEHPCISLAAAHDYDSFVRTELGHRKEHRYPPYQRLARIIIRSKDEQAASDFADKLAVAFEAALPTIRTPDGKPAELRLLGPAEAPVFRLKGYYRFHFQLQSPSPGALHQLLRGVLPTLRTPNNVELTVDIDPLDML